MMVIFNKSNNLSRVCNLKKGLSFIFFVRLYCQLMCLISLRCHELWGILYLSFVLPAVLHV